MNPREVVAAAEPLTTVNRQLESIDRCLEHLAQCDATVARLCTAPSVGPLTAAAFVSTIDDALRFKNAHQVEAYLGLTPSEMSSGEKQQKGHITKAGNSRLRRLLVQVAVSILRLRNPRTELLRTGKRGSVLGRNRGRSIEGAPADRNPPCAGELDSPTKSADRRVNHLAEDRNGIRIKWR
jgi:transposase